MLGLDDDTDETFQLVAELYRRSTADTIALFVATPFPGTPFYDRMMTEGRIFEKNWKYFNCCDITLTMKNFDLPDFCDRMITLTKQVNSPVLIAKKIFKHLVQYRNLKMTAIVAVVLISRIFNAYVFTIPDLYRSKMRTKTRLQQSEQLT